MAQPQLPAVPLSDFQSNGGLFYALNYPLDTVQQVT